MDERLRELERKAACGDAQAQAAVERSRCRTGEHCSCRHGIRSIIDGYHALVDNDHDDDDAYDDNYGRYGVYYDDDETARGDFVLGVSGDNRYEVMGKIKTLCERLGLDPPHIGLPTATECPYCSAKAGEPCKTKTGRRARQFHASRGIGGCHIFSREPHRDLHFNHTGSL